MTREDILTQLRQLQWKLQTADVSTEDEDAALAEAIACVERAFVVKKTNAAKMIARTLAERKGGKQ